MDEFRKELEDYFCRFTFGQFVTLILLEIVTLFFVFYLGARYGPDLLGRREADVAKKELPADAPSSIDEIVGKNRVDYTYPEVLTGEGDEAIRVKPSGVTSEEYEEQKRVGEKGKSVAGKVGKTVEKQEGGESVTRDAVTRDAVAQGKFAVQVGSYPQIDEATGHLDRWRKKGYKPFLSVGQIPQKGTWYRIRIGGFETRQDAEKFLETLKEKEKIEGLVVLSNS